MEFETPQKIASRLNPHLESGDQGLINNTLEQAVKEYLRGMNLEYESDIIGNWKEVNKINITIKNQNIILDLGELKEMSGLNSEMEVYQSLRNSIPFKIFFERDFFVDLSEYGQDNESVHGLVVANITNIGSLIRPIKGIEGLEYGNEREPIKGHTVKIRINFKVDTTFAGDSE
jgi:hypothetical protein